jgi:hypothetical protein
VRGVAVASDVRRDAAASVAVVFDRLFATIDEDLRPRWSTVPPSEGGPAVSDDVVHVAGRSGATSVARVWVHSTSGAAPYDISLRMTDLVGPNGERLRGSAGKFDPPTLWIPPESTLPVTLHVAVPLWLSSGLYSGRIVSANPGAEVAVHLVVAR